MKPRGVLGDAIREPTELQATSQRDPWNICKCRPPIESGRLYLGERHCVLCEHLIDTWGTRSRAPQERPVGS